MFDNIQDILPYMTGALFILALLLFASSLHFFRRSRTDVFWRRRRDAGQRGWRALVSSFVLIMLSGLLCALTLVAALVNDDPPPGTPTVAALAAEHTPTLPLTETPTAPDAPSLVPPTVTPTAPPAETPTPVVIIVTTTPVYTPTVTPFPTFTPRTTLPVSDVTPDPDATIRITALDNQISDSLAPVNPRAAFRAGTTRIYFFVEFADMTPGMLWRRELNRDGVLIDGGTFVWGRQTEGSGYFFFGNDRGFTPGDYDIRLFIGDDGTPVNIASFTIVQIP